MVIKMKKILFPGSFDPPTLGHLDIIKRASKIFDYIYIAIGLNTIKQSPLFSIEQRIQFLKTITENMPNIEIVSFHGLLVDFAKKLEVNTILRSIRNFSDLEYENTQAQMNRKLEDVETIYMVADEQYRYISSSLIREIASYGRRLHAFIPNEIEEIVFNHFIK
jgi:pantetheine-phosphate adenylyltransferase